MKNVFENNKYGQIPLKAIISIIKLFATGNRFNLKDRPLINNNNIYRMTITVIDERTIRFFIQLGVYKVCFKKTPLNKG